MKLQGNKGFIYELCKNRVLYLMALPVVLFFLIFSYLPMTGIIIAFKNYNYRSGIFFSEWVGFDNFKYFVASGKLFSVTKNTIFYNLVFLTLYTVISIVVAILISEMQRKLFKKIAQTMMFLPYFISWVTVSALMYNFFNYEYGALNAFLRSLGEKPFDIYSNATYWVFMLPILYVWKWVGFGSVLYLAAIMGIDVECYESAAIEGANAFQKIYYITLPLLRPTMVILVLLGIGRIMRGEFDMFYQLIGNNGTLVDATEIIDTLVFRSLMGSSDFSMASAAGLYQSVLCFLIIIGTNALVRKYERDYALF